MASSITLRFKNAAGQITKKVKITLPDLTGSEKQVAWAQAIRQATLEITGRTHPDTTKSEIESHTEASWWITNRYGMGVTMAQQKAINARVREIMGKEWTDADSK